MKVEFQADTTYDDPTSRRVSTIQSMVETPAVLVNVSDNAEQIDKVTAV